jgi:predicted CXXCH cytochrome family protein
MLVAVAAFAVAGCSDDKIVYRDRAPFNPPPDAALGFLGYYDATAKQTTCGNCHSGFQAGWQTTKHANAWSVLQSSSAAAPACEGCHTVTGNGNVASGTPAGHATVPDEVYYDVQCESCHGPGLEHVEGVGQGNIVRPLAKLSMEGTGNCGDCHSGAHQPFAEDWRQSRHAVLDDHMITSANCSRCHEGRGALMRNFNEDVNFQEKETADAYVAITCGVCHDPHGSGNPSQLRFPITSQDPAENLCMRCHLNRDEPTGARITPHAPQGGVLLGQAGWRPPNFAYDTARIFGSHATTRNPKLCAGCHVNQYSVVDQLTGEFSFTSSGHLFRPIPCLDATGKPTADKSCEYTVSARAWNSCTGAGCHDDAAVAANLFNASKDLMKFFADQLWTDLNGDGTLQPAPTDGGLLATVKANMPGEWTDSQVLTPAEGAEFNARLCGDYGSGNSDNSKGVHNPFLCRALLIASIDYVKLHYGLTTPAPTPPDWMSGPLGQKFTTGMHISRTPPGR